MGLARAVTLALALAAPAGGQCVMCFRTAEAQNAARAQALNRGILVMAVPPVLLFAGIVYWAKRRGTAAP